MTFMIIDYPELEYIRKKHSNKKIVFAGGCFDITHAGHVVFLEDAKRHGDVLVAQVASDDEVRHKKGNGQPVFSQHIRLKMIDSLKPVDYAFIEQFIPDASHPLEGKDRILKTLKPDTYIVNTDSADIGYLQKLSDKYGVQLVVLGRHCPQEFENISTSKIIKKIRGREN